MSSEAAPAAPGRASSIASPDAVLALIAVAQFMVVLDATIVNVALPTIKVDVGFSEQSLSWVLNAYTLIFGGFLLLGGRAADRLGRRRLFVAGIIVFSAASLICGLSQSEGMLLAARGLQGLGGAMVSPAALSIILTTFAEGTERNRALAVWGAIAGAGGAIGLLLGGVIVEVLSWRWVFFVNVPIGAAVLVLTPRIVPESRSESAGEGGYDLGGAATITLGMIALVFTLIKADGWGWTSGRTLAGFAVAVVLLVAFVLIEQRHRDPLVPLRIFRNRSLAAADATLLMTAAALFGVFFFCTLYLQQVLGYSALRTGVSYLPLSLSLIAASALASRLVDRFTPKPVLSTGLLIATAGFVLLTRVSGHSDYWSHILPAMIVLGSGLGLSFVPVTIAATTGVAPGDSGLASGLLNTTQQVGGSLGLAILSSVSTSRTNHALADGTALPLALTHGFKGAFVVAAGLCLLALALAVTLLPGRPREPADEGVETRPFPSPAVPGRPIAAPSPKPLPSAGACGAHSPTDRGRPSRRNGSANCLQSRCLLCG
ncbi:MAG TPA: MFS transporter [Solirubrobacterales bacterium]|nr:MFS transporter [Solirubrobacterales bacterium]